MGPGVSVFLLALGAVLTFAVETDSAEGINVNNVGVILMIAGAIGLAIYAAMWGRRDRLVQGGSTTTVVEAPHVVRPVVEERIVRTGPVVEERIVESGVRRRIYE